MRLLLLLLFLLPFASCNREIDGFDGENTDVIEREISMQFSVPNSSSIAQSKSISTTSESAIETINVLSFKELADGTTAFQYAAVANYLPNGSYNVVVRVQDNAQQFVVIANAASEVSNITSNFSAWYGQDKETVLGALEVSLDYADDRWNALNDADFRALPMWGESSQQVITGTTTAINETIDLMRMVAKVEVQLDESITGLTEKFKLKSVYLYNSNRSGMVVPSDETMVLVDGYKSVTAPTLPHDVKTTDSPIEYRDFTAPGKEDIAMKGAIYTFETKAPSDNDKMKATCLVVGGLFDGDTDETFYRVDFITKDAQGKQSYLDILRNNKYVVNIVQVTGSGYTTPDIAYRSKAENMSTNILYWNEAGLDNLVFDGQSTLAVSTDSITMWREEFKTNIIEDYNVITILTDYITSSSEGKSGWYVESIVDAQSGSANDAKWLTLSQNSGEANVKAKVGCFVDLNNSGIQRSAIVTIAAGRLRFAIEVIQLKKQALSLKIYDEKGNEITYLYFNAYPNAKPAPRTVTVKWTPINAALNISVNKLSSIPLIGEGFPQAGVIDTETDGELTYIIEPDAFSSTLLEGNPFAEKTTSFAFTTTDGDGVLSASLVVRQSSFNMTFSTDGNGYVLGGQVEAVTVYSNYAWEVAQIEDEYDILQDEETMLLGLKGGNQVIYGDDIKFKMGNSVEGVDKHNKTAIIHLKNLSDFSEKLVYIRAEEHLYAGYFSGNIVEDVDGKRHFEHRLYLQDTDESGSITWQNNTDPIGIINNMNGKQNTLDLMNISRNNAAYDFPAARTCFQMNAESETITGVDDSNYVWYLPSKAQLFAIWIIEGSFSSTTKLSEGTYWTSSEIEGYENQAWITRFVKNDEGHTMGGSKTNTNRLRCVRKAK
ncbi:MAG: hypothetical protein ACK5IJ_00390 [Mangrovibacterium sp.]